MKIKVKDSGPFRDGRKTFEAGGKYNVPDRRGGVYVSNGWADELPDDAEGAFEDVTLDDVSSDAPKPAQDGVTLDVQDVNHEAGV